MAYNGKTNWTNNEIVEASDMNRIEQGILDVDAELGNVQTALDGKVDDNQVLTNVPANAKFTDTVYTHPASHPVSMITGLAASLAEKVTGLMAHTTLHVAKTGSDDTGDGSAAKPYLTIQKAVDSLPRYLTYGATITVHAGVYDENLYINLFSGGGEFTILGADGETVSVKSITAQYIPARLWLQNLMVTGTHNPPYNTSLYFSVCPYVVAIGISCTQTVTEQAFGAVRAENGTVLLLKNTTISNKQIALDVAASTVYLNDTDTGANNVTSIRCGSGYGGIGGYVQKGGATIAGVESTAFSGQIF